MAREQLLECSFLIPVRKDRSLSDGRPQRDTAWKWLDRQLGSRFEGATRALELYEGWYDDPDTGERITDLSQKYFVAIARKRLHELRVLLREACKVFFKRPFT